MNTGIPAAMIAVDANTTGGFGGYYDYSQNPYEVRSWVYEQFRAKPTPRCGDCDDFNRRFVCRHQKENDVACSDFRRRREMKLTNIDNVNDFLAAVDKCKGEVYLTSAYGDKFNLKSLLSRYVAMGALIDNHYSDLELWCDNKEDEHIMLTFFNKHPEAI